VNKSRLVFNLIAVVAVIFISTTFARAQATRTWVSGVGDDANPCSRTAPCKTFAGAISKTAPAGEIDVLDPGGFGAVTITKSIHIESQDFMAGVLVSGTNAIIINAGANDVVQLRGLTINGMNTGLAGIKFLAGGALRVEHCWVYQFAQPAIDFEPSQATDSSLVVLDTVIKDNAGGGVLVKPVGGGKATATLDNVRMMKNAYGTRNEDNSKMTVRNSVSVNNTGNGFLTFTAAAAAELNLENVGASFNGTNGVKCDGANSTVRVSNSVVSNNTSFGFNNNAGTFESRTNNTVRGNNGGSVNPQTSGAITGIPGV
jgi:hypothetical protein